MDYLWVYRAERRSDRKGVGLGETEECPLAVPGERTEDGAQRAQRQELAAGRACTVQRASLDLA